MKSNTKTYYGFSLCPYQKQLCGTAKKSTLSAVNQKCRKVLFSAAALPVLAPALPLCLLIIWSHFSRFET